ncbi:MAG: sel1 repeat family protein [Gammaproteobacteria bacterium]|nr:sel1 repeat family protein [Gammaproteobacteria bacterium]
MSNPTSRQDFETSLSRKKIKNSRIVEKQTLDSDKASLPRRQNVIGGNLSGVSQTKRFGWLRRFGDSNITLWALVIVIALILAAFLWPQAEGDITKEVTRKLNPNNVIAIDDKIAFEASTGKASFTNINDKARADAYRAQDKIDQQVAEMLRQADQYLRSRQFTLPAGANAVSMYKKVLKIRPENSTALANLEKIRRHYEFRGVSALENNDPDTAESNLSRLSAIDKRSEEYTNLAADIADYRSSLALSNYLSNAKTALQQGDLFEPENESAIFYAVKALELDQNNIEAKTLLESISDQLVELANDKILSRNFSKAASIISVVKENTPDHKSIPLLDAMLSKAMERPTTKEPPIESTRESSAKAKEAKNTTKTPTRQANEQAEFDLQYLRQGLASYQSEDYGTAIALLQPLADKGISRAQIKLAIMNYLGLGFDQNIDKSQKIVNDALPAIRRFANEGRGWAQSALGELYEYGLVLPRDLSEAIYWYRTAADSGEASAQFHLGTLYELGNGVTQSRETAIEWYRLAASKAHPRASRKLINLGIKSSTN